MRCLIFHPAIAPYRIDFFNELHDRLGAKIFLYRDNLKEQAFDKLDIESKLHFKPGYFSRRIKIGPRDFYIGHMKRLKHYRPNVVISGEYGEGLWCAVIYKKFINKKCRVYSICDDSPDMAKGCKGIRRLSRDLILKHIDGLILCCRRTAKYYRKRYDTNSFVFPIIEKAQSFYEDRDEAKSLAKSCLKEHDLKGKKLFLFVGRLSPEKNIEYLIRSFVIDHGKHPDNRLVIVGGDNKDNTGYGDSLKKLVAEENALDYILFTGQKEGAELKAWMYLGQCLLLTSTREAFGAVVGEALLAGEYVMVSSKAGAAELVSRSKKGRTNGEIIDVDRPCIDFDRMTDMLKPLDKHWKPAKSKLAVDFDERIEALIQWIK